MSKKAMTSAMAALKELVAQVECRFLSIKHDHFAMQEARAAIRRLEEALDNHYIWVGLTPNDLPLPLYEYSSDFQVGMQWAEAKLKEKNYD